MRQKKEATWQEIITLCAAVALFTASGLLCAEHDLHPEWTRVTHDGDFKQRPAWSPDGTQLTFARHRGAELFLYLCDADGANERRLTERAEPECDAVWSPDGKRLAFSFNKTSPNQGDIEVYTVSSDGRDLQPVAVSEGKLSHEEWPAWSLDGKWIAYSSTKDDNQEIYLARPDGSEKRRLTTDPALDAHPCWSPDGHRIAFATDRWGDLELAMLDVESAQVTRLTESPGLDDYPTWSPDGKSIAFTSNRDRNLEIYVIEADGKNARNVTRSPSLENFPIWGPEGQLTFVSNWDGGFDVYSKAP